MKRKSLFALSAVVVVAAAALVPVLWSGGDNLHNGTAMAATPADQAALIKKGEYLARAGDCIACHTVRGGKQFAGGLLYPGFPFTSYTKVTRADSDAIYAYLRSVTPVNVASRPHELKFPFNQRNMLIGWRTLFFREGEYKADPTKSVEWNRGAYLIEGLGHCGM